MPLSANIIDSLDKAFDNRLRLGIMSALMVNKSISFKDLKDILQITDGNLASHLKILEENKYIIVSKGFIGRKTNTTYSVTVKGKQAFMLHLNALEKMIEQIEQMK